MSKISKIREDFPFFKNKDNVYVDNACMTLRPRQVIDAVNYYYNNLCACGGRSSHDLGKEVSSVMEDTRKNVRKFINAKKDNEIIFTKNTTHGLNIIASGLREHIGKGNVVVSSKEHNSNLLPWQRYSVVINGLDKFNIFDINVFKRVLEKYRPKVVSIGLSSNLDGTTVDVRKITKLAHDYGAIVVGDAAQCVGHHELNVKRLGLDLVSFSGHKMMGPSIGVMYGKEEVLEKLKPEILGGGTVKEAYFDKAELEPLPHRFEAGLHNYEGIFGLNAAVNYIKKIGYSFIKKQEYLFNRKLTQTVDESIHPMGPLDPAQRAGIFSFNIKGINHHDVADHLNKHKFCVRSGRLCVHSYFNHIKMDGVVRVSGYLYNTEEEAENIANEINNFYSLVKGKKIVSRHKGEKC